MSGPDGALGRTLDALVPDCLDLLDPWWLIGSAAAHLLGLATPVRDVDLLVSRRDGATLLSRWGLAPLAPEPSELFCSGLYARRADLPLAVEIMADFHVRGTLLLPETRVRVPWPRGALFVPELAEQAAICRRFGRPNDLARAERLQAMSAAGAAGPEGRRDVRG